jgi:hypothetical protein
VPKDSQEGDFFRESFAAGQSSSGQHHPEETHTMKWTLVRYRAKPERADENQRLSAAVFDELIDKAPAGLRYAVFRLPDDTFVHIAMSDDGGPALTSFESFRAFQKDIRERCAEPPQPAAPVIVGNYGMLA